MNERSTVNRTGFLSDTEEVKYTLGNTWVHLEEVNAPDSMSPGTISINYREAIKLMGILKVWVKDLESVV